MDKFDRIILRQGKKVIYDSREEAPSNGSHHAVWINSNDRHFNFVVYEDIGIAVHELIWNWSLIREHYRKILKLPSPNIRQLDERLWGAILPATAKALSSSKDRERQTKSAVNRFFLERDYFDAYVYDVSCNPDKYSKTVTLSNFDLRVLYEKYQASERSSTQA
jgi:hypothetical protein